MIILCIMKRYTEDLENHKRKEVVVVSKGGYIEIKFLKKGGEMVLRKAIGITLMGIAIVCSMGVNKGNAQGVDESKITEAFVEAVNREVDLGKPVDELNYREVYKKLVPIFSKLVLETIRTVSYTHLTLPTICSV